MNHNVHTRKMHARPVQVSGNLNCIIIEHNNKQSAILHEYITKTSRLHFAGRSESAADIYQQVLLHKVDVIFWDIKLLDIRIIQLLRESGHYPIVICIATKTEQEKKETDMDIFSYLTKPLSFERFLNIIDKIKEYLSTPLSVQQIKNKRFIFIKSEYKIIKVKFEDILFCEGMKDYTQVYLKGKSEPILTLNNLKLFFSKLPADEFIRVHRSYIVSINHIDSIARNEIYIGKKIIPVGDSYKDEFYQVIDAHS
ncbi:MAG: response regulator transcription factor [Bacteroidetes bacterium]|nr:response regulator transcription factor [Bacteroidota bacterium]MBS1932583.1 response regulator transcription factor [Bacteroidota bacterium]